MTTLIVNFSDRAAVLDLFRALGSLKGPHRVELKQSRETRSQRANRYWFGVIVEMFRDYNRDQGVELSKKEAHAALKLAVLPPREIINHATGEVMRLPAESHTKDVAEFGRMIDLGVVYLSELGLIVPDPYTWGGLEPAEATP